MEIVPFASVDRTALRWLRTAEKPAEYTLLSGDAPVATLSWRRHGGSLAVAVTAQGRWTLKRTGFLSPRVSVRPDGSETTEATLVAHLRRHEITIRGGRTYRLYHESHILPGWRLTGPGETEVLHIEPAAERRGLAGGAVLAAAPANAPELLLLCVLSWYFIVLAWLEDELVETLVPFEGPDAPSRPS